MAFTPDERFRRANTWAADMGFFAAFPNFHEANYGLGRVTGVHLLRDTVADWRDLPRDLTYGGARIDDVPELFRRAATYAAANGFSGAFPTCHQGTSGAIVLYGTVLIRPGVATFRDVRRFELDNPDINDVPGMMRAAEAYATSHNFAAAFPTFHQAMANGQVVYGMILFPDGTIDWRDVYLDDLQPRQERTCVVLARFRDGNGGLLPIPEPKPFYDSYFFGRGSGGLADYYRRITNWQIELTGNVFGWFDIGHTLAEHNAKKDQAQRHQAYDWGIAAAQARGVNTNDYSRRVVIVNAPSDLGGIAKGVSMLMPHGDGAPLSHSGMQHEFGHVLGLDDSWWSPPDTMYGDAYCVMSWNTVGLSIEQRVLGETGESGPGINAVYVDQLGGLPPRRLQNVTDLSQPIDVRLVGLGNPERDGVMALRISPGPGRVKTYWIEYRHPSWWDRGIDFPTVVVHETRPNDVRSFLLTGPEGTIVKQGRDVTLANGTIVVRFAGLDPDGLVATVRIWRTVLEGRRGVSIRELVSEGPGDDLLYEKVVIQNDGEAPQNLLGWQLHDSVTHPSTDVFTYVFPSYVLNPGDAVTVWTRAGADDAANLYWGRGLPVWNNKNDRAVLVDQNGNDVFAYEYFR